MQGSLCALATHGRFHVVRLDHTAIKDVNGLAVVNAKDGRHRSSFVVVAIRETTWSHLCDKTSRQDIVSIGSITTIISSIPILLRILHRNITVRHRLKFNNVLHTFLEYEV